MILSILVSFPLRALAGETTSDSFKVVVFDLFAREYFWVAMPVCLETRGFARPGRLSLPRFLIGRERGIGAGRAVTSCVEVTKKSH